ncbi:Storkhead-box protein winged-helix domain [Trinorchestia longiramus]|nr:Storkhead-box protein winged-helix domain [Trinorchestia longiramus]
MHASEIGHYFCNNLISPSLSLSVSVCQSHYFLPSEVVARRRDIPATRSTSCPPPPAALPSCTLRTRAFSILHHISSYLTGEVSGCRITPVHKVQFTPLGPALCWVLHAEGGSDVPLSTLRSALVSHFPTLTPPDADTTHAALTELIKQRKVYHAGRGYSLVTSGTYGPDSNLPDSHHYDQHHHPPFRLLSTSEALTRAHGTAEATPAGSVTHAAVQTDLSDLLTHQPSYSDDTTDARRASLRLAKGGSLNSTVEVSCYSAKDLSDVSVRVDRSGSVLSKILRVSTPRMASFSAQFPPPEWSRPNTSGLHGHSRSTQTGHTPHVVSHPKFSISPFSNVLGEITLKNSE